QVGDSSETIAVPSRLSSNRMIPSFYSARNPRDMWAHQVLESVEIDKRESRRKGKASESMYKLQTVDHVGVQPADFDSVDAAITRAAYKSEDKRAWPTTMPVPTASSVPRGSAGSSGGSISSGESGVAEGLWHGDRLSDLGLELAGDVQNDLAEGGSATPPGGLQQTEPNPDVLRAHFIEICGDKNSLAMFWGQTIDRYRSGWRNYMSGHSAVSRSSSSSIPFVAQYEFLSEPVVHRFSEGGGGLGKRSFHTEHRLHEMIEEDGTFHMEVRVFNTTYALIVEGNTDLVHPQATMTRTVAGQQVRSPLATHDIGVYRGHVLRMGRVLPYDGSESLRKWARFKRDRFSFDEHDSWARLSVYRDGAGRAVIDGAFAIDGETMYVKPAHTYARTKRDGDPALTNPYARAEGLRHAASIVYRQSDLVAARSGREHSCGSDRLADNQRPGLPRTARKHGMSRRTDVAFDGNSNAVHSGCSAARKLLYMGAAADCSY
ncbi:hypothetical protein H4S07_005044, partial [Coemansia furcata]